MRRAIGLLLLLLGTQSAAAGDCQISGPRAALEAEVLDWSFVIASGQTCIKGLRANTMILDNVRVSAPAQVGQATTAGNGFAYKAPQDFKGEDMFVVMMSGSNRGVRGTSTIRVRVSVR